MGTSLTSVSMAGLVVDPTAPPARPPLAAPLSWCIVLVAVAFGLVFGAMACAADLAGGVAHGATGSSTIDTHEMPSAHADHPAPTAEPALQPTPAGDHGDHSGGTSTGGHPGMACVVSVDLHVPEASPVSISDSSEIPPIVMSAGCPDDVDPPVPRSS